MLTFKIQLFLQLHSKYHSYQCLSGVKRASLIVMVLSGSPALFGVTTVLSFTQRIFKEAGAPLPVKASILTIGVKVMSLHRAHLSPTRRGATAGGGLTFHSPC